MPKHDKPKICFVIAPIGREGSPERDRSNKVLNHIIKPTALECGYEAVRADQVPQPGMITPVIIEHLMQDPLVIADLTDHNPNVFYELAIRHIAKKPVLQIIHEGQGIPFDVSPVRAIEFNYQDLDSAQHCREELQRQIKAIEADPTRFDNPISNAIDVRALRQSDDLTAKGYAEILTLLQELLSGMAGLNSMLRPVPYPPPLAPFSLPWVGPVPPPGPTGSMLADALRRVLAESGGPTGPTGAVGPTGPFRGVGPTGPSEPPPASPRDVENQLFDALAQEAPPSGVSPSHSDAEPQKPKKRLGKGPAKA